MYICILLPTAAEKEKDPKSIGLFLNNNLECNRCSPCGAHAIRCLRSGIPGWCSLCGWIFVSRYIHRNRMETDGGEEMLDLLLRMMFGFHRRRD